jgi:hypothetical protein
MDKNNLNISKIETYLNSIIDNIVSDNTFFASLPDVSVIQASTWQDMVMIAMPEGIKDFEAYGAGSVFVYLYARPFESGKKNVSKMAQLETKLNDVVEKAKDKNYQISRENVHSTYDDDINWHCNVVELILKVF